MSKIPLEMSRLTDEDLVNIELEERQLKQQRRSGEDSSTEEKTTRAESMAGMPQIMLTDQFEQDFIHRGRIY